MESYEKLGAFYLGRPYDLGAKRSQQGLFLYDSKDLVTHAVCVGMTGSGKTGLGIALLEEAAIDGVPSIVIDPKGDLSNLLLTFPQLLPEDFAPWVNEEDAAKKGLTRDEFAREQADLWREGLGAWGQSGERIARLQDAAEFSVYTPGSTAGRAVSMFSSFAAPPPQLTQDAELLGDRIQTTVTGLLALLGIEADPVRSREHILLSTIFDHVWRARRDLDLGSLIQAVQNPPVSKIGVLELETFYSAQERFKLAMTLNNLLAAPGFSAWLEGEPLAIDALLHTAAGKPRVSIFSIAHLNDSERMFCVSLLLNQVLGWMRSQSGTTSLRAILYMDEIFGFFPPVANPPSKAPLLTLLKQARAYGLGVVLATQNPVDLDYKGLSNTGTWFVGRLQTERDKARLIEGLEGAAAGAGARFDRAAMEETLAGLGKRVFLMNNVHDDEPLVFETRWVMSYLRGPLTRDQIARLMEERGAPAPAPAATAPAPPAAAGAEQEAAAPAGRSPLATEPTGELPILPPDITQRFVPLRGAAMAGGAELIYKPTLWTVGRIHFDDRKTGVNHTEDWTALVPLSESGPLDWQAAMSPDLDPSDLEAEPGAGTASYMELPAEAARARSYSAWSKELVDWIYRNHTLELHRSPTLRVCSEPGESERDFRLRLQHKAREARDEAIEKLRKKYAPKLQRLEERIRRAEQAVEREAEQAKQQKLQAAISFGSTLLSAVVGRKAVSRSSLGRATTAARGVSRSMQAAQDVERAADTLEARRQELEGLEAEFQAETAMLQEALDPLAEELEVVVIRPKKKDVAVTELALAWTPHWRAPTGELTPGWQ